MSCSHLSAPKLVDVIVPESGLDYQDKTNIPAETARIILGHRSAAITEVYAVKAQQKALEAIVRVG